jgi:hypothetical protein
MMEPTKRDELLGEIAQAINSHGGSSTWITKLIFISLAALIAIEQPSEAAGSRC